MKPFAASLKQLSFEGNQMVSLIAYLTGGLLLAMSFDRFIIALSPARFLTLPDPIFGIPLRLTVLGVGMLCLAIALVCLFSKRPSLRAAWVAWLATNFMVYQIGLFSFGGHQKWTCLGGLTDPFHLSFGSASLNGGFVLPGFLLMVSVISIFWLRLGENWIVRMRNRATLDKFLKMSCPACGIHIRFDGRNLGQTIPCPHCQTVITLRKPDLQKMTCFFCKGHIEFPAHAIGEKIPCPHCKMDITLKEQT